MEDRKKADEAEQKKITEELEAMDKAKTKEDIQTKQKIDWKEPK